MNVHLLGHLSESVREWGPMWAYSCCHFENEWSFEVRISWYSRHVQAGIETFYVLMCKCLVITFHLSLPTHMYNTYTYTTVDGIIMQALPPTLSDFQNASSAISTLADNYGRERYVVHVPWCPTYSPPFAYKAPSRVLRHGSMNVRTTESIRAYNGEYNCIYIVWLPH